MLNKSFQWFPESASNFSGRVDALYAFMVGVTVVSTVLICIMVIGFGIYYRRGSKANRRGQMHNNFLELIWASGPLVVSMIMFAWGAVIYFDMHHPPEDAMNIEVVGKQWMWKIRHPGGKAEINSLHVPAGQPVRLRMISEDVIHSFFVPAFRVKQDVVPGYYTQLWFTPTKPGTYHLFCAEYCGTEHSGMIGTVTVLEPSDYARWLADDTGEAPEVVGQKLFDRFRCATCHKAEGNGNGPALTGIFGKDRPLKGGGLALANEQYLRDSIMLPNKQVLAGYQAVMPSFQGQITEEEVTSLIAYIKTLKGEVKPATVQPEAAVAPPEAPATEPEVAAPPQPDAAAPAEEAPSETAEPTLTPQ
ncbi:cytochrome c oxidase subunit II [Planctomicrobium sp. SH668]|uniref:cytochrome c oxidase subunit II n=1 Tax=Planctomicrobium sp. SH668 TaxID=3448126 RepID=UPI003F5CADED